MSGTAVHFGAGNIGRGFVGLILHRAGYEVVFADVADTLIDALAHTPSYVVKAVGHEPHDETVDGYRAINSRTHEADVIAEIAAADIVTTAVGPTVLRFVAPVIAAGLHARTSEKPLTVMACENAINATDVLVAEIRKHADDWETVSAKAVFANTAVDRIVPAQAADAGLDVTVETYFEWAIEKPPFAALPAGQAPVIPDATWVDDLAPYIERKLFTVNTGHASTAYHGYVKGISKLSDALADPEVRGLVEGVLAETKALLVAKHDFPPEVQQAYLEKILTRFENPYLPDTVDRVGRQPLRKLSRHERLIGPAAELAERGQHPEFLLKTVAAALRFDVPADPESVELAEILATHGPDEAATRITGLEPGHPLYDDVVDLVTARTTG
ncbi:mannitol-1-phosphate 5-dehydrogenase [Nakamurella deserti]|uniref:mannitol-1-phosphate 5-dehydrogenase n=1 Tax=Nakamurella deserti TaxID=2164074 RepID=UPI000DBE6E34|nr:mannitol-1-phosphate 5-dehydrogenase [Nakamurella deserti]